MKIIQINTVCGSGSVGRITTDLYEIGTKAGYDMKIAYGRGSARSDMNTFKIGNPIDMGMHVLRNFLADGSGFGSKIVTDRLIHYLQNEKPDVIHLHNLHGFYVEVQMLFSYLKDENIKTVWTLHDCWPFTGHCAFYEYEKCDKWKTGCGACKAHRRAYPYALFCDNSANNYLLKKACFTGHKNLVIVTPSEWLKKQVEQSFLKEYFVKVIYNGVDLDIFKPMETTEKAGFPGAIDTLAVGKKIILGVANVWEKRKGMSYFEWLADHISEDYQIVIIGVNKKQQRHISLRFMPDNFLPLIRTESIQELAKWYGRAFVFVNPTLEDNFPTTNLEALACGTPVISFDTGGSPEALDENTGRVVKKGDKEALLKAITSLNCDRALCRSRAEAFDKKSRFSEYLDLYED